MPALNQSKVNMDSNWPATVDGPITGRRSSLVTSTTQRITFSFEDGITPNTDYNVWLLARWGMSVVQEILARAAFWL